MFYIQSSIKFIMKIKVGIAEDNSFLLGALKEKISFFEDLAFKYSGANGKELIRKIEEDHNVEVILIDIQMPEMDGIEATEIIKTKYPHIKIIMLTIYDSDEYIFNAIRAGADGYLLKETNAEELHSGILDVLNNGASMTPSIALRALNFIKNPPKINLEKTDKVALTNRESEILVQISKGLSNNFIAENLFISPATVRKHIENIYKKLSVHNKVEAVQKGIKHNLI